MAGAIFLTPWKTLESKSSKGKVVSVMAMCVSMRRVMPPEVLDLEEAGLVTELQ